MHTVETARVIQTEKLDTTQQMNKTKKVDEKIDATQLYFTKYCYLSHKYTYKNIQCPTRKKNTTKNHHQHQQPIQNSLPSQSTFSVEWHGIVLYLDVELTMCIHFFRLKLRSLDVCILYVNV